MRNIWLSKWKLHCHKPDGNEVLRNAHHQSCNHLDEIAAQTVLFSGMVHNTSWLGRVLEYLMCCSGHHVGLDEICVFFHCIIVQNLDTERGDPSPSSMCSLSTQLVMCKSSLTDPEPCHCDLLSPDETPGWLSCLLRWFHSFWLPSVSMIPVRLTKQLEEELCDWCCLPLALGLYSHAIVVSW